jgi:hypothetical protein
MKPPPAVGCVPEAVSRGSRENEPRAFAVGRGVRVIGEDGNLIEVCPPDRLDRYLAAANADVKRRADGSIRLIRLRSTGDDHRQPRGSFGKSTITTERVRNDWGVILGSDLTLQHKKTCLTWGHAPKAQEF